MLYLPQSVVYEFTGAQKFKSFVRPAVSDAIDRNGGINAIDSVPPEQGNYIVTL